MIVLEVGHGDHPEGFEPGAVDPATGTKEHDVNGVCANAAKRRLSQLGYTNVTVTDYGGYLGEIGRKHDESDIFISCHHNAFSDARAQGAEAILHVDRWSPSDEKLALLCAQEFSKALGITNRGIKYLSLSVLSGAISDRWKESQAVCLIEPYFITGSDVDDHHVWSNKAGSALADAIHQYLNMLD